MQKTESSLNNNSVHIEVRDSLKDATSQRQTLRGGYLEPQNQRNGNHLVQTVKLFNSPQSQTASTNISKRNFWSRCNQNLALNLKAPFILFSGETDGEEHETDKR